MLLRDLTPQERQIVLKGGVELLHIEAAGVTAVDGGYVKTRGDGEKESRGVGIALDPLGILGNGRKIHVGKHVD